MKIAVCIATYNEGPDLEATIYTALASRDGRVDTVVVYDDASDKLKARKIADSRVRVIHGARQVGSGQAKIRALLEGYESGADVLVASDSHMRYPYDFGEKIAAAIEYEPNAIWCCTCRGFETDHAFIGCGADVSSKFIAPEPVWRPRPKEIFAPVPCVLGACYFAKKEVWEALAGFNPFLHGWGFEEIDLSLKAHLMGIKVMAHSGLVVQHRFDRDPRGYLMNSWEPQFNAMVVLYAALGPETFERVYETTMRERYAKEALTAFDEVRPLVHAHHNMLRTRFKVPYEEIVLRGDFAEPTEEEQRSKIDFKAPRTPAQKVAKPVTYERHPLIENHIGKAHMDIMALAAKGKNYLEWGVGGSTLFFRAMGFDVHSVEHSKIWAGRVGGPNVVVVQTGTDIGGPHEEEIDGVKIFEHPYASVPHRMWPGKKFDVILVDGILRNACLIVAKHLLAPGGKIYLHDSQRDWYEVGAAGYDWVSLGECLDYPGARMSEGTPKC